MRELRNKTGQKQQIIAAACSIDHARQIRALYEQRGLEARELYSEMDEAKQEGVMAELEQLQIDCIVQVQMLGEGFDHPPLSVAAVYRPFRSLSPYVQFVGRIMRVMFQDDPANSANHGYVVSHIGLNNDANWRDFREFDLEDQQVFRDWLESQTSIEIGEANNEGGKPRRFDEDMVVHDEIISDFIKQSFLDASDDRVIDKVLETIIPGVGAPLRKFFSRDEMRKRLKEAQEQVLGGSPQELPVSPQKRRIAARKRLADRPKSVAARVLRDLHLSPNGFEISRLLSDAKGTSNLIAAIRLIHAGVNEKLGVGKRQRNKPSANQAEATMAELDAIGDAVRNRIQKARQNNAKN